ncbi:hypothetical protein ACFYOT_34880 [Saccharothrix saharensis]|uniref:hypothetical protein n=1 Tax=Saccharothrix saharensis TaxID=571190 RepID=UPI003684E19A
MRERARQLPATDPNRNYLIDQAEGLRTSFGDSSLTELGPMTQEQLNGLMSDEIAGLVRLEAELPPLREPLSVPEGSQTRLSQEGGLMATEGTEITDAQGNVGERSHPLEKHGPDAAEHWQKGQARTNRSGIGAKFTDRAVMETVTAQAIEVNQPGIRTWLDGNPPAGTRYALPRYDPGMGNLGEGFFRNAEGNIVPLPPEMPLTQVQVVLISTGQAPPARPCIIHTVYPTVAGY